MVSLPFLTRAARIVQRPLSVLVAPAAALAAVVGFVAPHTARAQTTLFSNLEAVPSGSSNSSPITASGSQQALAFTTGSGTYTLTSVQAYLSCLTVTSNSNSTNLTFGLYTPAMNGNDPGTLVGSFGTQTVTGPNSQIYTFTPSSAIALTANTRYVLLCDYVSSAYNGFWSTSSANTAPTARNSSDFSNPVYRTSTNNGVSYTASTVNNLFALNGTITPTATPEPGTLPLLGMGLVTGLGMVGTVRRRKQRQASK